MKAAIEKLNNKAIMDDGYKVDNYKKRCIAFDTLKIRLLDFGEYNIQSLYPNKGFAFFKELCGSLSTIPFDYEKLDTNDFLLLYAIESCIAIPVNYNL